MRLTVYYTEFYSSKFEQNFIVQIKDFCEILDITEKPFAESMIVYTLGRPMETASFSPWVVTPSVCNFSYVMTVEPNTATVSEGLIKFDSDILLLSVYGTEIVSDNDLVNGAYIADNFTVKIKAWGDNSIDTGHSITLTINVLDPCDPANGGG